MYAQFCECCIAAVARALLAIWYSLSYQACGRAKVVPNHHAHIYTHACACREVMYVCTHGVADYGIIVMVLGLAAELRLRLSVGLVVHGVVIHQFAIVKFYL